MSFHDLFALSSLFFSSATTDNQGITQCEKLKLGMYSDGIINTTHLAAGSLSLDGVNNVIPFCRVFSNVTYSLNHSVVYEAWLPDAAHYNGRYLSVGKWPIVPFEKTCLELLA